MIWTPSRMKNKTCQRAEELLVNQRPSISSAQLCLRTSSCSWVTFYEEVGGRIWTPATIKPFIPKTFQKQKKTCENPFHGSTSCAASLCRAAHQMTGLGQSLRDPQSLMKGRKPRGNLPGSDCGSVCQGGAEVSSTRHTIAIQPGKVSPCFSSYHERMGVPKALPQSYHPLSCAAKGSLTGGTPTEWVFSFLCVCGF